MSISRSIVQRLSERAYFYGGGFYTTTFYVGDTGVLVFDPPEGQGEHLLQAISQVTSLPVTAIAYSHGHADHMIGAPAILLEAASAAGVEHVRIISSTETVTKMALVKSEHAGAERDRAVAERCLRVRGSDRRASRVRAGRARR